MASGHHQQLAAQEGEVDGNTPPAGDWLGVDIPGAGSMRGTMAQCGTLDQRCQHVGQTRGQSGTEMPAARVAFNAIFKSRWRKLETWRAIGGDQPSELSRRARARARRASLAS